MLDSGGLTAGSMQIAGGGASGRTPRLQFSVPCLQIDDQKGPPSFMYVFYEMPFPEFPFTFPEGQGFFVANGWCNGLGSFVQRMKILDPDRKQLVDTNEQPFQLKKSEEPFMAVNFITGMQFSKPGTYWIQIYLDNQLALEYPLPVRQAEEKPEANKS